MRISGVFLDGCKKTPGVPGFLCNNQPGLAVRGSVSVHEDWPTNVGDHRFLLDRIEIRRVPVVFALSWVEMAIRIELQLEDKQSDGEQLPNRKIGGLFRKRSMEKANENTASKKRTRPKRTKRNKDRNRRPDLLSGCPVWKPNVRGSCGVVQPGHPEGRRVQVHSLILKPNFLKLSRHVCEVITNGILQNVRPRLTSSAWLTYSCSPKTNAHKATYFNATLGCFPISF